jgi:hypothetical protein
MYIAIILIVPAIIAFILMFAKLSQMNTAVKQIRADSYMKRETLNLTTSKDVFLYSNTVRTPRPKSKN